MTNHRLDGALREPSSVVAPRLQVGGVTRLPSKVDLREHCSPVEDQGLIASCAACAVVGAMEYLTRKTGDGAIEFSRLFVYYNGRRMAGSENVDGGLVTTHAMASVLGYGACTEQMWPYLPDRVLSPPPQECYVNALAMHGVQYAQVPRGDAVRHALAHGFPVVFRYFGPRDVIEAAATTGRVEAWGNRGSVVDEGGHTMLIVGYDEDQRHVLVRNSWGTWFGDGGYMTMPYDTLEATTHAQEFWTIGRLADNGAMQMTGASMSEALAHTQLNAARQHDEALSKLRRDLRKDLQDDLEAARRSVRDRLRGRDGGGGRG